MSAEKEPPTNPEQSGCIKNHYKKALAVGLAVTALGGGVQAYNFLHESGEYTVSEPVNPLPEQADQYFKVGSWNMHNETAGRITEIRRLADENQLDVLNLQEVNTNDKGLLERKFPRWYISYVLADTRQEIGSRGYGDVMMTREAPQDIKILTMKGDSLPETGTKTLVAGTMDALTLSSSLGRSRAALLENRAAIAMTLKAHDGNGGSQNIRVINTHLAPQKKLNAKHFKKILEFAKDNTKDKRPTILCGDLNASNQKVIPAFAEIGFITPQTGVTTDRPDTPIDYCTYADQGVTGLGEVAVQKRYKTDHHAIIGTWTLRLQQRANGL